MEKATKKAIVNTLSVLGGALIGNVAGAAVSGVAKAAPLVGGVGVVGLGLAYADKPDKEWLKCLAIGVGAGMITAPTPIQSRADVKGLSGVDGILEDMKANANIALQNMSAKVYLHKTPLAKYIGGDSSVKGLGEPEMSDDEAKAIVDSLLTNANQAVKGLEYTEDLGDYEDEFSGMGTTEFSQLGEGSDDDDLADFGDFAEYEEVSGIEDIV